MLLLPVVKTSTGDLSPLSGQHLASVLAHGEYLSLVLIDQQAHKKGQLYMQMPLYDCTCSLHFTAFLQALFVCWLCIMYTVMPGLALASTLSCMPLRVAWNSLQGYPLS
jgi:hypothetical protein